MIKIIVILLFFASIGCTKSEENEVNFVASDSSKILSHARMENIEVIFDEESSKFYTAYELALAHFKLFKLGSSIKQLGLSLDVTDAYLEMQGDLKKLSYSINFSFTSLEPNITSLKILKEVTREKTAKLVGASKGCFGYLGSDLGHPWNLISIYPDSASCTNEKKIALEEGYREHPVKILRSETVNQSARPDTKSLVADGELSFYFLMVDDKAEYKDQYNSHDVGDEISPEIDRYFRQVVDPNPVEVSDDIFEYKNQSLISGVNVRVRIHRIKKDIYKHLDNVKIGLNEYDVFSYNGHSNFGNSFIYDLIESSNRSDYWILQLNACWSNEFVLKKMENSVPKPYDFIGHSETIWFSTFPLMNQMLFQTVLEEKSYFSHLNQLEHALFNSKGDRLERMRKSGVEDLLPGTIVLERGI